MADNDTRKHERTAIQTSAHIETDRQAGDCILMDFSNQGLGMLLNHEEINIGQRLNVTVQTAPRSTIVQGIIKWSRKLKETTLFNYAIGLELIEMEIDSYGNLLQHAQS